MLKNYLVTAWRNLTRGKLYSGLNIGGLAIGLTCSVLILLWVQDELSFDRFHKNSAKIGRIVCNLDGLKAALTPVGLTGILKDRLPQVRNSVRVTQPANVVFSAGNRSFEEKKVFYADDNFLQFFSYPLIEGDPATALKRVDGALITREMARKYFGNERAVGKFLRKDDTSNVVITGVFDATPSQSHLQFDFVLPIAALNATDDRYKQNSPDFFAVYSYMEFSTDLASMALSLPGLESQMDTIYTKQIPIKVSFQIQPLTDIHLRSAYQADLPGLGNIIYVKTFFAVALIILFIACINFMNLATARSARRAREVGVRKVIGASRGQLIRQFLGESLFLSFFSLCVAITLVWVLLPFFNEISEKQLTLDFGKGRLLSGLLGIALVTGLLAGIYPAIFLSGFKPVKVLKASLGGVGGHSLFRNGLVVLQFSISIILLSGTLVVYQQLTWLRTRNLGFEKANLLYMPIKGAFQNNPAILKTALNANPLTANFTLVSQLPSHILGGWMNTEWPGKDPNFHPVIPTFAADEKMLDVFQMKIIAGRGYTPGFQTDSNKLLINEKAMQVMGMNPDNAMGKTISFGNETGQIIGVVKDFNFKPAQQAIEPLIISVNKGSGNLVIRTRPGAAEATINALAGINRRLNPAYPFTYGFVDQDLDNLYKSESRLGELLQIFAVLAILVSCLGLYGLSAFMAERRTKEIGLRKVLGASVLQVVYLLSTGFTRLVFLAILIAVPLSWYSMSSWLDGFAYHITLNWIIFGFASLAALLVAWLTVSYESIRTALTNPARSLRAE